MISLAAVLLLGCPSAPPPEVEVTPDAVKVTPVEGAPGPAATRNWAFEVEQTEKRLALARGQATAAPASPRFLVDQIGHHQTLARLRGGDTDTDAAWAIWEQANRLGPDDPAVRRTHASLLQGDHRFREALAALEGLETREDRAVRAAIRFELGEYEPAVTELTALLEVEKDPATAARLAGLLWKLGRFEEAETWMEVARSGYHGRAQWVTGWHHLMFGLFDLDRERYDDAMVHYRDAEAAFPGWWLVQEHMAEIHAVQGRHAEALGIYEAVVAQTGSPELMGAMADTLDALGRTDDGKVWRDKALAGFTAQLAAHPTRAGGHALEFLLEHGEPAEVLAIARANVELRPNGEAKLLLADALEKTGDTPGADALRAEVAASGWWMGPS